MSDSRDPSAVDPAAAPPGWAPLSGPPPVPHGSPPVAAAPAGDDPAPSPYATPQPGFDPSAQGWGAPQQWGGQQWGTPQQWAPQQSGPPGELRRTGTCVLLTLVTLGIYAYVYNYKVHREMKAHSGRGVGGGVALLLTFVAGIAMPFVTSAEVGGLYSRRGEREPVNGWTGLWLVAPAFLGYLLFFVLLVVMAETLEGSFGGGAGVVFGVALLALVAAAIAGAAVWFVKTNGALNRYWASLGVS